ncbi:unannotated protein [freshwater metagenome]|uniref:Unannotated protein n=1 Tax=freshwater metagenome TaxID=449393 RepID=A0A6J7DKV9_9ZZZZ
MAAYSPPFVNPTAEIVQQADPDRLALLSLGYGGERRQWSFADVAEFSSRFGGWLQSNGVAQGDTVMTVLGSRPEWVLAMLGIWRIGAVALPCHSSLRPHDLDLRIKAAQPALILCEASTAEAVRAASPDCLVVELGCEHLDPDAPSDPFHAKPSEIADLAPDDPAVVIFTSGTTAGPTGIVHGVRWLAGQEVQAHSWFGAPVGSLAWCTAAPGWSKSARNVFLAPWICGASALIHDAPFDADQRLEVLQNERVGALCQAPTEYRVIAARLEIPPLADLTSMVAAGEALDPEVIERFRNATGLTIRDGYGQTETGHLTGVGPDDDCPAGSMGKALPGIDLWIDQGELVVDPTSVPTFFLRTLDGEPAPMDKPWRTGDLVRERNGFLFFEGRDDDIISSSGYRIGPFEVESAMGTHPAVAECAAVAAPDRERGSVVRAVVVLRDGFSPSDALAVELGDHVKQVTAPYKYPRIVDFVDELPKTSSGKIRRSVLRGESA